MPLTPPTPYVTLEEAIAIYGSAALLSVFDVDGDGVIDTELFALHAQLGADEMNGFMLGQLPIPDEYIPPGFKKYNLDLAMYSAALDQGRRTDEIEKRAERALEYMRMVARGTIKLPTGEPGAFAPSLSRNADISIARADEYATDARQFTARSLRGLV